MYEANIEINTDCELDIGKWDKPSKSEFPAPSWSQRTCSKCRLDCTACDRRRSGPCHNPTKSSTNNYSSVA